MTYNFTKFLEQRQQLFAVAFKSRIVVVPLQKLLVRLILSDKGMCGLVFQPESVDESVIFLKIMAVFEKEDYLVDMFLAANSRAQGPHQPIAALNQISIDDRFYNALLRLLLHLKLLPRKYQLRWKMSKVYKNIQNERIWFCQI